MDQPQAPFGRDMDQPEASYDGGEHGSRSGLSDDQWHRETGVIPQYPERRWFVACLLGMLIPLAVELSSYWGLFVALPMTVLVALVQRRILGVGSFLRWMGIILIGGVLGTVIFSVLGLSIALGNGVCGQIGTALVAAVVGGVVATVYGCAQWVALAMFARPAARGRLWMTVLSWTVLLLLLVMVTPYLWRVHCTFRE